MRKNTIALQEFLIEFFIIAR